ncbi:ABC transporter substrate-binding protein [Halomonas sp. KAO]|uniref:ABC transporter substrate-binding protein n=1 Tax=Halomonas sp. KAO TaxID=2783858 RepID=UPI00189CBD5A|nr:ABC transporter substrate-binding protein [Halomonas sp. KAO]MBF7054585.1 ABC transporter substrate-binding protein [Halomonas sp. KAO]
MIPTRTPALGALAASMLLASQAATAAITDNEIRIGYLADMTGAYRDPIGPLGEDAIRMAIEDMGGKVAGAKVVLFSADDRNSPDVGSSVVREWIDERNVDMVTGLVASSVTLATVKLLEEENRLGLVNGAVSSSITNENCSPNHVHWVYDTWAMSNGTASAITREGNTDWYLLSADYSFGHALERDVARVVEESGGNVVGSIRHPFPSSDFSSYMLQAIESAATDEAQAVRAQMAATPIDDIFASGGYIREDGRMVHDMYLVEVKSPQEAADEDDIFRLVRTIPAAEAFRPLDQSDCRLITPSDA